MSEMTEIFRAIHEKRQNDRSKKRMDAPALLAQSGICFESKNCDAHLIVKAGNLTIDFWPGTERWIIRGTKKRNFGIESLIQKAKEIPT